MEWRGGELAGATAWHESNSRWVETIVQKLDLIGCSQSHNSTTLRLPWSAFRDGEQSSLGGVWLTFQKTNSIVGRHEMHNPNPDPETRPQRKSPCLAS